MANTINEIQLENNILPMAKKYEITMSHRNHQSIFNFYKFCLLRETFGALKPCSWESRSTWDQSRSNCDLPRLSSSNDW